jgi:hypothetical protein
MYRSMTRLTAVLMVGVGVAILVRTALAGGGVGLLLGVLFVAAGGARLWMLRRRQT